jgi:uncharacterized protein (DUF885 family)
MIRRRAILLLLVLFIFGASAISRCAENPQNIDVLFDRFFREYLELTPETGTQLGLTPLMGYRFRRDALDDVSEKGIKRTYQLYRRYQALLKGYDLKALPPSEALDARILGWYLDLQVQGEPYAEHAYAVNSISGIHVSLTNLLTLYHTIGSLQDARDYVARLSAIPRKMDQTLALLDRQEKRGIVPSVYVVERVEKSMAGFIAPEPKQNLFYTCLKGNLDTLSGVDPKVKADLCAKAERVIAEKVYPSYARFIQRVKVLEASAPKEIGVWRLPEGDRYYRYTLRWNTSTALTSEEVHQLGLSEVARIQGEMKQILDSLGFRGDSLSGQLHAYWDWMNKPEQKARFGFPDSATAKAEVVRAYQAIIDSTQKRLPRVFSLLPKTPVSCQEVPLYKQATSAGAYYEPGSLDGKRKGVFFVNTSYIPDRPEMPTLAYHEAVPGHHLQIAIQQEYGSGRMFKQLMLFNGYVEGWALYTERLANEQGWSKDPHERLGYLGSELFRAIRLVLDTGIHAKRWTRDQARQYMASNQAWGSYGEIDRYSLWPGQACGYKVGELRILQERERARRELGARFDLKEFHKAVLQNGSLPLDLLTDQVDEYIRNAKASGK